MGKRRIVITGIGVVAPNGIGKDAFWESLINGQSGIKKISSFDASSFPVQIAGEVKNFDACKYMDFKTVKRTGRFTHFAVASAKMAVKDAKIEKIFSSDEQVGIYIGSAAGGRDISEREHINLREKGLQRVSPFSSAAIIANSAATEVSIELGYSERVITVSTGCTAGLDALGIAYNELEEGKIDIAVAGGTDGSVTPLTLGTLCKAGILSLHNGDPSKASRPFDAKRSGGVLSEGAGIVILEELEHALNRNAGIYGEIVSYGSSTEASSLFETDANGNGFIKEMGKTLDQACLKPEDIDYICAHAPSDIIRDRSETLAIKEVFGDYAYKVPISSIKSMIGNPFASAGLMQLIASLMTIKEEVIPPTINYEVPDPKCDLDYVPNKARKNQVNTVLINSHGFGGSNASMIVSKFNQILK
ncbi:MAG: beta-ketoacyl-[acyl-carrier-protein] synthase family protein [Candidatus Ratteibacteria bacterium]|nr:beta-ketoacyl-[acyl-carrier-protein] synthase family protein [Candidatus Ratteibacteria bacterium]